MNSSSALRRLKVTYSHLKQEESSSLGKNTTSGLSPTSKVIPLPPHLPIFFDKLRKRHQFIEDLDEAKEFLGDYTNFTNTGPVIVAKEYPIFTSLIEKMFIFFDPPKHTPARNDIRQILSKLITSKETENFIQKTVDELLTKIEQKNGEYFEFMSEFSRALTLRVIAFLLGIDVFSLEHEPFLWKWVKLANIFFFQLPVLRGEKLKQVGSEADKECQELVAWFRDIVQNKKCSPNGLIYQLIEGNLRDKEELASLIALLLFAGHDSTATFLGNMMIIFATIPEQYQELRKDPSLLNNAIEEGLRIYPSFPFLRKRVMKDIQLSNGKKIKRGLVNISVALINRSPKYFENGDMFDIHRDPKLFKTLTFGHGIHMCIGRELAKLESRIAIKAIASRFQEISFHPSKPVKWKKPILLISPEELILRMK